MNKVIIFGKNWCINCKRVMAYLTAEKVKFEYKDLELDEEAKGRIAKQYNGVQIIPTVKVNSTFLANPSNNELREVLGLKSKPQDDVRIFTCGIERPNRESGDESNY